jgi:hypothetical protein
MRWEWCVTSCTSFAYTVPIATMPRVLSANLLRAVYAEASRLIEARKIPTELVPTTVSLYRSFDQQYATINTQRIFPRQAANAALTIRDQSSDVNRFSGQSFTAGIPAYGGLYCSMQAQAIVNEVQHYARSNKNVPRSGKTGFPHVDAALRSRCIVRIRLMSSVLAADISTHNPGRALFLEAVERSPTVQSALRAAGRGARTVAYELNDSEDCSLARGIGLAIANAPWLRALKATTARPSDRSPDEAGDNLIVFGRNEERVGGLWVDAAYLFPLLGEPIVYPVEFAANT